MRTCMPYALLIMCGTPRSAHSFACARINQVYTSYGASTLQIPPAYSLMPAGVRTNRTSGSTSFTSGHVACMFLAQPVCCVLQKHWHLYRVDLTAYSVRSVPVAINMPPPPTSPPRKQQYNPHTAIHQPRQCPDSMSAEKCANYTKIKDKVLVP